MIACVSHGYRMVTTTNLCGGGQGSKETVRYDEGYEPLPVFPHDRPLIAYTCQRGHVVTSGTWLLLSRGC